MCFCTSALNSSWTFFRCVAPVIEIRKRCRLHETKRPLSATNIQRPSLQKILGSMGKWEINGSFPTSHHGGRSPFVCVYVSSWDECLVVMLFPTASRNISLAAHVNMISLGSHIHIGVLAQRCVLEERTRIAAFCSTQNRAYRGHRTGVCVLFWRSIFTQSSRASRISGSWHPCTTKI